MSSLLKSSQASSEATTPATDAWPDSSASPPDLHKPTLPSFKEILPRSHIESKPPRVVSRPLPLIQPAVKTYQLPFRRAKDDIIKMPYTMIKPENEGIYSMTRKTVHGKTLTYTLTVRQQPERARACGAGARACADRRPVDPPPVVELRIFEGESTKTDITLSYNASFFLFATLEVARPIANGRMHPCPSIPVLTGCPVAAANYLDRPSPAAYFLFPDLSVRHEGWYRLSFNLYEATKEAEDFDIDRPAKQPEVETITAQQPSHNQESIPWRLEVKSNPFQVYSAKKFPGLSESTEISRIVADQGCRVRIRRDIRMRKRNSSKDDYDAHDDGIRSNDQYATSESVYQPQTPIDCRQSPNGSVGGNHYGPDPYYRGSLSESTSSHTIQSARPSTGQSGTFFTAPPQPVNTAKNDVSTSTASPYAPIMTGPRDFAVPLPPVRLHERPSVEPAKAYLPQPPKTAAPPPSLVAEDVQPPSRSNMHLPALLTTTQRPQGSGTVYDPTRRQWNLPEATASKRSHSPRSDHPQQALKQGMRPDKVPVPRSQPSDTIEADNDPYEENDQLDLCANGFMEYRRACGRSHRKRVPNLLA